MPDRMLLLHLDRNLVTSQFRSSDTIKPKYLTELWLLGSLEPWKKYGIFGFRWGRQWSTLHLFIAMVRSFSKIYNSNFFKNWWRGELFKTKMWEQIFRSFANNFTLTPGVSQKETRSLIKNKKRRGPIFDPWGTPELTSKRSESLSPIFTLNFLSV